MACTDHKIRLMDEDGRTWKILVQHTHTILALAFSPDGRFLASASANGTLLLWPVHEGHGTPLKLDCGAQSVEDVAFSPCGRHLASASQVLSGDGVLHLWRVESGDLAETWEQKGSGCLAFSKNGFLVHGSTDGFLDVLKPESGEARRHLLRCPILDLCMVRDGVACACENGNIEVVYLHSGGLLFVLKGHACSVSSLASFHNGNLFSAGTDGVVCIWDLDEKVLIDQWPAYREPLEGQNLYLSAIWLSCDDDPNGNPRKIH